jgi:LuxR family transcriptional regulator, maltose regulon positive regulatory protein
MQPTQTLATKLFIPPLPPNAVLRPRLVERLREGLHRNLTLISAPAGFGKTTLLSAWVAASDEQVAWLSLDEGDNDRTRFLNYLIAAVRTIAPTVGEAVLDALHSPQPPPTESILTAVLNDIAAIPDTIVLVIDDYHVIDAKPVEKALTYLIQHLPPRMRLVIATREDPQLPLARLRGGGKLSEVRAADLRFTPSEAAAFLNQAMGLNLSVDDVATLEKRTEGWIAGLQLAALSLRGQADAASFIHAFSGSHHFVLDYLLEEVLQRQSDTVQSFLLRTSILDQMCAPLCDAVVHDANASGQATLEYLARANLFLVPLDNERRWYRYHHLFADLLRQRVQATGDVTALHSRASQWYEDNGLELEAFVHAAAADEVERAERLVEGHGVPLHYRGAGAAVTRWLESLSTTVLNARPSLWVTYATALLFSGRHSGVEHKLQAAEAALEGTEPDERTRDLIGRIASIRATLAIMQRDRETIIAESRRALEYLHPDNLSMRTAATYTLGYAQQLQGDRAAARRAYAEVIRRSTSFGGSVYTTAATLGLGQVQELDTQLVLAKQTYERVLELVGEPPRGLAAEAHLGLARIAYEWNDLEAARRHGQQGIHLARQMDSADTVVSYGIFLARLRLAQDDVAGALAALDEAEAFVRQHNFLFRLHDLAAARVLTLLRQGHLEAAAHLAEEHELPISRARVHLAKEHTSAALALLEPFREQVEIRGWADERLKVMILQALALQAHGDAVTAVDILTQVLALAERAGFVRTFVDEGIPMARLLSSVATSRRVSDYVGRLQTFVDAAQPSPLPRTDPSVEPLSTRELEVLRLITQGLSNQEIGERLFLALDTVKGHNRRIFGKLQVQRRTEAVARARELGLT